MLVLVIKTAKTSGGVFELAFRSRFRAGCREEVGKKGNPADSASGPSLDLIFASRMI
jgi:hypothetical protein